MTLDVDYSDTVEPSQDSVADNSGRIAPYYRTSLYPDFAAALNHVSAAGAPPANALANDLNHDRSGPIAIVGLSALFATYYPGQDLKHVFGNSGYALRTAEYGIDRGGGGLGAVEVSISRHEIEVRLGTSILQQHPPALVCICDRQSRDAL